MAIYHFSVQVISRSSGRSAVAAAAYRAGDLLHDERLDRDHDFRAKAGVEHSEILLPENAPDAWRDRERLWNDVEAFEKRKDAQLAREVEFAIPREMTKADGIALARDFAASEFVARGMIADLNVHWDMGADGRPKPHAHVMLTMREAGPDGFGQKVRDWNRSELVEQWRERWAEHVNQRLAELDIDTRIDHRSLAAQGIDLEPQDKIGPAASRMGARDLESERLEEHRAIARRNGECIIAEPRVALDAITHQQATFTRRDLAIFVHRHSDGQAQFDAAMAAVRASPDLVALGKDGCGDERFTSREMIETEQRMRRAAEMMAERDRHHVGDRDREAALANAAARGLDLSGEQRAAFDHATGRRDLGVVVGYAGTGKSAMLGVAREAWERAGFTVHGAALSGIAAEGLENGSGIASRTLASLEHGWAQGRDPLTARDVLVIDEAGMVGTRQMERVLSHAAEAGAKVVLVGDPQQLQSIEAGAAFRAIHSAQGGVEITEVRRQRADWQRDATRHLATGRTGQAIAAYAEHDMVHTADTREAARGELVERWDRERRASPDVTRIILTHTNAEVRDLNETARGLMRQAGELGADVSLTVTRGARDFASGDRVMFLRNERGLGVKNGTLGTIEQVDGKAMTVRTDTSHAVSFDLKDYADLDHGYAATIHKAQGMTVDRAHVLATPGMDAHGAYVALSRHRDGVDLHYGRDEFADQGRLTRTLSRERGKDMASDHAPSDPARAFAERRGIGVRERIAEVVRKVVPERVRAIFDGLDLGGARRGERAPQRDPVSPDRPDRAPGMFDGFRPNAPAIDPAQAARVQRDRAHGQVVERHARAVSAIWSMHDKDLPVLPHQTAELDKAREAMNTTALGAARDMEEAFRRDGSLVAEAAGGRPQRALQALQLEREIRTDPDRRADRFVAEWRGHDRAADAAHESGDREGYREHRGAMGRMTKQLERDPQLESVLRGRDCRDLGLEIETGGRLAHDLAASIGFGRERDRGLER
ncbi:Ti-type conjugative transfer relaxase TraA [Sphingomonadaceae bacterium jetA1]|uniref:Ti-type conjugative transfer relaxase TraA n=1 Tax=Facivitalis istanbulensis TaxID=3075838 RepID=UPI003498E1ED